MILKKKHMEKISYASEVGSIMCTQVFTQSNITYVVDMFGWYQSNPCIWLQNN